MFPRMLWLWLWFSLTLLIGLQQPASAHPSVGLSQTRCGWFDNPSAGNATLLDRDGEWVMALQGQHQAKGAWPRFPPSRWVLTGAGAYGYGCVCMRVLTQADRLEVTQILSTQTKPLSVCRKDHLLQEPVNPLLEK